MNVQLVTKTIGVGKYEGLTSENEIPEIMQTINWRDGYFM